MSDSKTVVITGANRGIGEALAKVFTENGWNVVGASRDSKDYPIDLSDQKSIEDFVAKLGDKPIDVLINNAGIFDSKSVDDDEVDKDMDKIVEVFRINTVGPRLLAESLIGNLKAGSEKLVVTITSKMGSISQMSDYSAEHWPYSSSKTATNFATISLSKVYPGIKAVVMHPGWVRTDMGGVEADVKPEDSAKGIFDLVTNHKTKLKSGMYIDYRGYPINF